LASDVEGLNFSDGDEDTIPLNPMRDSVMVSRDGDDGGEAEDQLELLYEDMDRELADEIQTEKYKRLQKKESDDKVSK